MNPTLHYKIYGEGVNKQVIPEHAEYIKPHHLHYLIKNYI